MVSEHPPRCDIPLWADQGYVRLRDVMGSDLTIVNAARVSYAKRHETLTAGDRKLIRYLAEHRHTSPFYHGKLQFECRIPLFTARQMFRHIVDSAFVEETPGWNELSYRYVQEGFVFYRPPAWRLQDPGNKQGSIPAEDPAKAQLLQTLLGDFYAQSRKLYAIAQAQGVAGELARLFLPGNAVMTTCYWTASLWATAHFVRLRAGEGAQSEIQDVARAVSALTAPHFPVSWEALQEFGPH